MTAHVFLTVYWSVDLTQNCFTLINHKRTLVTNDLAHFVVSTFGTGIRTCTELFFTEQRQV